MSVCVCSHFLFVWNIQLIISKMFQEYLKDVFKKSSKGVSRVVQGIFKGVS